MTPDADLLTPLRRYWGYSSFRPLQERIVRSLLAGHDTCVVMPTGGGKSLCYQLPAVVSERTTIVISPLIALMQDQAAQLAQMGIPAAVVNSSISNEEQSRIIRQARDGAFRLLYLSPERLQRADTLSWLKQVPISYFAIDEAHCISEWGHEFRPEYRQLSRLRGKFPDCPIAAFTASATQHVRHDILTQLELRNPDKYIASFHRPNLRYLVRQCDSVEHTALLVTALRHYDEGNVIVYSPTISKVEETVDFLEDQGIAAVGYHAKMDSSDRRRNQERWMSDEVRVLVGTIAFGLGINKATVRSVIHLALPKSVEQFYQEAGRAGRDGKPADCILLWRKQDAGLLAYFANQILDETERQRAWERYQRFADLWSRANAGTARSARILGRRRSGNRAGRVTFAKPRPTGSRRRSLRQPFAAQSARALAVRESCPIRWPTPTRSCASICASGAAPLRRNKVPRPTWCCMTLLSMKSAASNPIQLLACGKLPVSVSAKPNSTARKFFRHCGNIAMDHAPPPRSKRRPLRRSRPCNC